MNTIKKPMREFLGGVTLVIVTLGPLASTKAFSSDALPFYNSPEFTPHWIQNNPAALNGFHKIPEFDFVNQEGERITESLFSQKIVVANFFFTSCPGICPMIRSKLSNVQEVFADDESVNLISHSIRPGEDTVDVLKTYAERNGINSRQWHLLTGDRNTIYRLAKEAYFANEDLGNIQNQDDFLHTENVLLIDEDRHIRGIYNGLNTTSINHLIADIKTLKAEMNGKTRQDNPAP